MICDTWIDELTCDTNATEAQKTEAIQTASEVLYALSGRQYPGLCQETVRPCANGLSIEPGFSWSRWTYPWYPVKNGATWLNLGPACGCHVTYDCACNGVPQVDLGRSDVQQIFTVNIDGTELSAGAYRLDHGQWLVRTDGNTWPCCQDLSKDIGETGTWYIELEYGAEPPQMGRTAAQKLACELAKAAAGGDCDLPERVATITRQGVTMALLDPQAFLTEGRTGLYEVDLFLSAANPNGLSRRATAWSPEVKGRGRRVGVLGS